MITLTEARALAARPGSYSLGEVHAIAAWRAISAAFDDEIEELLREAVIADYEAFEATESARIRATDHRQRPRRPVMVRRPERARMRSPRRAPRPSRSGGSASGSGDGDDPPQPSSFASPPVENRGDIDSPGTIARGARGRGLP